MQLSDKIHIPNYARSKSCRIPILRDTNTACSKRTMRFKILHAPKRQCDTKCNAIQKCIAIQKWNNPKVPQSKSKSKNPKMQRSKSKCNDSKVSVTIQNRSNPKVQLQKFFINTDWKTSRLSIMIQSNPKIVPWYVLQLWWHMEQL